MKFREMFGPRCVSGVFCGADTKSSVRISSCHASLFGGTASDPRPSTGAPVSVTEECVNEEADDDVRSSIAESRFTGEGVRCCGTLFSRDFFLSDLTFGPPNKLAHKPPSFLCLVDDVPMMHTDVFVYRHVSASDGGFWSNARHT